MLSRLVGLARNEKGGRNGMMMGGCGGRKGWMMMMVMLFMAFSRPNLLLWPIIIICGRLPPIPLPLFVVVIVGLAPLAAEMNEMCNYGAINHAL